MEELAAAWSSGQDVSLVQLNNTLAARLHCKPELVSLGELYLTEAELASPDLQSLLVTLSGELQQQLLPLVDYRTATGQAAWPAECGQAAASCSTIARRSC